MVTLGKSNEEFIEIMPIEYHLKVSKPRHPRLQIYWGYSISDNVTLEKLNRIKANLKNKKKISISDISPSCICWKYRGKPPIYLDKLTRKVKVTKDTLEHFGWKRCQQQASLVLRILRGTKKKPVGLASFRRVSVTFNPKRIGRKAEEREITFQAAHDLFNDRKYTKTHSEYRKWKIEK